MSEEVEVEEDTGEIGPPARSWLRQIWLWTATLVFVVIAAQAIGQIRAPSLPDQAPLFELQDLDGRAVRLEELRGKIVVLNFWATWCAPCRSEVGSFSRFAKNNPEIVVLGIAADGPVGKLRAVQQDWGIGYPVLDGTPEVLRAYQIDSYPTTVIVDPDGRVASAHVGLMFRPQLAWATWIW